MNYRNYVPKIPLRVTIVFHSRGRKCIRSPTSLKVSRVRAQPRTRLQIAARPSTPKQESTGNAPTTSLKRRKTKCIISIHCSPGVLTSLQMLRMEYEKEVVLNIRHRVEMHEQQQEFDDNVTDKEYNIPEEIFNYSHVHLSSRQRGLKLLSYEISLEETLGFRKFGDSLAEFLRDYALVDVYGSDFDGDGFEGHQHYIYWCKVIYTLPDTGFRIDQSSRSFLIVHAESRLIVKRRPFRRRKSSTFHQRGADQGRGMIRPSFRGQRHQASSSFRSVACSASVWRNKHFGSSSLGRTRNRVGIGLPDTSSSMNHPTGLMTFTFWTVSSEAYIYSPQPTRTINTLFRTSTTVICTSV